MSIEVPNKDQKGGDSYLLELARKASEDFLSGLRERIQASTGHLSFADIEALRRCAQELHEEAMGREESEYNSIRQLREHRDEISERGVDVDGELEKYNKSWAIQFYRAVLYLEVALAFKGLMRKRIENIDFSQVSLGEIVGEVLTPVQRSIEQIGSRWSEIRPSQMERAELRAKIKEQYELVRQAGKNHGLKLTNKVIDEILGVIHHMAPNTINNIRYERSM